MSERVVRVRSVPTIRSRLLVRRGDAPYRHTGRRFVSCGMNQEYTWQRPAVQVQSKSRYHAGQCSWWTALGRPSRDSSAACVCGWCGGRIGCCPTGVCEKQAAAQARSGHHIESCIHTSTPTEWMWGRPGARGGSAENSVADFTMKGSAEERAHWPRPWGHARSSGHLMARKESAKSRARALFFQLLCHHRHTGTGERR
jgi:hypothetical protein